MKRLSVTAIVFLFLAGSSAQGQQARTVDALFVHHENSRGIADAVVWQEALREYQVECRLISKTEFDQEHLSGIDVIIVGARTADRSQDKKIPWFNYWGDPQLVYAIAESELPVIGISGGGLSLFGQMNMPVGGGYYAHGSEQLFTFAEHASEYLESPFSIERVDQVKLSTRKQGVDGYHLPPSYVESILQNVTDPSYYSVVRYKQYAVWGAGPTQGILLNRAGVCLRTSLINWPT